MTHPYIVNSINGLVLVILGLASYVATPGQPATALVTPIFGLLLLACTYHLRRHNRFVFHTVAALTLLAALLLLMQTNTDTSGSDAQDVMRLLMGLSCFAATAIYVSTFMKERRRRNNSVYKDDL